MSRYKIECSHKLMIPTQQHIKIQRSCIYWELTVRGLGCERSSLIREEMNVASSELDYYHYDVRILPDSMLQLPEILIYTDRVSTSEALQSKSHGFGMPNCPAWRA